MLLKLFRTAYLPSCTLGELFAGPLHLYTIERPWIPNPKGAGGLPRESCVPDGSYNLLPHDSVRFPGTYALLSHPLGVYQDSLPAGQLWGRTAILIHKGNVVTDVIGCIAIGAKNGFVNNQFCVLESGKALESLQSLLGRTEMHQLIIQPTIGTQPLR